MAETTAADTSVIAAAFAEVESQNMCGSSEPLAGLTAEQAADAETIVSVSGAGLGLLRGGTR